MKKQLIFSGILIFSITLFGQEVIAHWDFSKGKIDSADGKIKMNFRGNTRIAGPAGQQYLDVGINNKNSPEGIVSRKMFSALTPKGAFRLEFKARLREQTTNKKYMIFWDNSYHMDPATTRPKAKKGLILYLSREKDGKFRPLAAFGLGEFQDFVYGNPLQLEEDQDFSLALEYDGVKSASFFVNGKVNRTAKLKNGGPLAQAVYPLVIGDRFSSGYNRFDGQILEVKLTALPSQEK